MKTHMIPEELRLQILQQRKEEAAAGCDAARAKGNPTALLAKQNIFIMAFDEYHAEKARQERERTIERRQARSFKLHFSR